MYVKTHKFSVTYDVSIFRVLIMETEFVDLNILPRLIALKYFIRLA
jgi:hypothetical protein